MNPSSLSLPLPLQNVFRYGAQLGTKKAPKNIWHRQPDTIHGLETMDKNVGLTYILVRRRQWYKPKGQIEEHSKSRVMTLVRQKFFMWTLFQTAFFGTILYIFL